MLITKSRAYVLPKKLSFIFGSDCPKKRCAYGLVIVWALVGIAVKQSAVPNIVYIAEIGAVILAIVLTAFIVTAKVKKLHK